VSVVGWVGE